MSLPRQSAGDRRRALMNWLCARPAHSGLTAQEIVDVSGLYEGHYRYSRCFDDLNYFARLDMVHREGRPARWVI